MVILCVITYQSLFCQFYLAVIHRDIAKQATQQSRFTNTIGTDNSHTLASFNLQAEVIKNGLIKGFADFFSGNGLSMQFLVLLKTNIGVHATGRLDVLQLNLVYLAGA